MTTTNTHAQQILTASPCASASHRTLSCFVTQVLKMKTGKTEKKLLPSGWYFTTASHTASCYPCLEASLHHLEQLLLRADYCQPSPTFGFARRVKLDGGRFVSVCAQAWVCLAPGQGSSNTGGRLAPLPHRPLRLARAGPVLKRSHVASSQRGKGGNLPGTAGDEGRTGEGCRSTSFWLQKHTELKPDGIHQLKADEASGLKLPDWTQNLKEKARKWAKPTSGLQVFVFIFLPLECFCGCFHPLTKTSQKCNDVQAFGGFLSVCLFII